MPEEVAIYFPEELHQGVLGEGKLSSETQKRIHQHPCLGVAHCPLCLVQSERSLPREHPGPSNTCRLYPSASPPSEDTSQHLQQLHRQKFIIPQHLSSQAISEKLVFLSLQGELQVKWQNIKVISKEALSSTPKWRKVEFSESKHRNGGETAAADSVQ